jgi:transposase-like protein
LKIAAMREIDLGKSMATVARMYQLSPKRLEVWKGEWRAKGELAFPGKGARPQPRLDAERIAELERKIGQQTMELDFLKKALRRFREQPLPAVGNGNAGSMSKSGKQPKRRQR